MSCEGCQDVVLLVRRQRDDLERTRQERDTAVANIAKLEEELRLERQAHRITSDRMEQAQRFGQELQERVNRMRGRAAAWKQSAKRWRQMVQRHAEPRPLCECGHSYDNHLDDEDQESSGGCLVSVDDNEKRGYCDCKKYRKRQTITPPSTPPARRS